MEEQSDAPQTIHSLPQKDGAEPRPWASERIYTAVKTCLACGKEFHPRIIARKKHGLLRKTTESEFNRRKFCSPECREDWQRQQGILKNSWRTRAKTAVKNCLCCGKEIRPRFYHGKPMREDAWNRTKYCSISCSKKVENPMFSESVKQKVSEKLKELGHKPPIQGGNGKTMPLPQKLLSEALNAATEYPVITTENQRNEGAAHCYKLDVALPYLRLGIQLDGAGHSCRKVRRTDKRIRNWLAELGWSVLHISNSRVLELCSTCKSPVTLLSSLTESWFTTAT